MAEFESNWANTSDVVRNHYGERKVREQFGGGVITAGVTEEAVWEFDYTNFTSGIFSSFAEDGGIGGMEKFIPANSLVVSARLEGITTFAGASIAKLDIGLEQSTGTDIDADGLVNDSTITANAWSVGAGALVGTTVGTNDGYLVVAGLTAADAAAQPTAGKARVIVEYIKPGS